MAAKMLGEGFLEKTADTFAYTAKDQNSAKITLSCNVFKINVIYAEIQDCHQNWQNNFFNTAHRTLLKPSRPKIQHKLLYHTISVILRIFNFH